MAQLVDLISRIFSSGRTQGLSGGAEVVLDQDPASAFYLSRLRKHHAEDDLVEHPGQLWSTSSYGGRKGGLRAHIHAERGAGIASFTDVLMVINEPDAQRVASQGAGDNREAWTDRAARRVGDDFAEYCVKEKFELLYGTRPMRFWIVADGGSEMLHQSFGLAPGEFITGLLPNLYVAPASRSRPVIGVHLNLPGAWEGYREVARLHSDQIVLTLGRHWLDNFHHPGLLEPGLYRLQQYPDGSLVHVISPELQDRYLVRADTSEAGPSVLTITETGGRPVAFLVLAVLESGTTQAAAPSEVEAAMVAAEAAKPKGKKGVDAPPKIALEPLPAVPAPMPPETTPARAAGLGGRQRTIIPDALEARILTLHERGALLQKVHFNNFMEGYDVYLGPKAQIATAHATPRATIQVRANRVTLVPHDANVRLDGKAAAPGSTLALRGTVEIEVDGIKVEYRDLAGVKAEGWPYLGELRRSGAGTYLEFGAVFQVGRDRRCKVCLPDEPHNENIAWLPSVAGGSTIRSRTGDIPKARFYTDSIMVASTHAEIDLNGEPLVRSLARHCYTYVRRGADVISLFPREGPGGRHETAVQVGDELLVGNCLFHVAFPPAAAPQIASPPSNSLPKFSAADLAAVVDQVRVFTSRTLDPVAPAGLGGAGLAPRPVKGVPEAPSRRKGKSKTFPDSLNEGPAPSLSIAEAPDRSRPPRPVEVDLGSEKNDSLDIVPVAAKPSKQVTKPPPPMILDESELDPVVSVEERQWQLELSRPARLLQVGWSVHGEFSIGNHRGVDMIVPEVKSFAEQVFLTLDYVRVYARGKKVRVELIQEGEASITIAGGKVRSTESPQGARIAIIRRDANLEPDFDVSLSFAEGAVLPDPRAQLLAIDVGDRLASALFTVGFPLRTPRACRLGPIHATLQFDGEKLTISDYLPSYRTGATGFLPFFHREGDRPWRTMPEDGSPASLRPGDGLLAGANIYRFEVG
ncbi:MAG: hypothetical protein FJ090_10785 [Deltaproteobacteria bacterium]|nr:hypothetical protein [Deltaproteobacteria bacterium]